jgi:hypothetical protein
MTDSLTGTDQRADAADDVGIDQLSMSVMNGKSASLGAFRLCAGFRYPPIRDCPSLWLA